MGWLKNYFRLGAILGCILCWLRDRIIKLRGSSEQVGTFKVKLCLSQASMDWKLCLLFFHVVHVHRHVFSSFSS